MRIKKIIGSNCRIVGLFDYYMPRNVCGCAVRLTVYRNGKSERADWKNRLYVNGNLLLLKSSGAKS
jgi:hypothetical protein